MFLLSLRSHLRSLPLPSPTFSTLRSHPDLAEICDFGSNLSSEKEMGNCWGLSVKVDNSNHGSIPGSGDPKSNSKHVKFSPPSTQSFSSTSFRTNESYPSTPKSEGQILASSNLKVFSFNDLKSATRNFRPDSVLGEGGFGCVFKGWIDEQSLTATKPGTGMVIAVKKLNQEGLQGHKEWLAEVNYLGQLSHPNLVKLIGYCTQDDNLLLVYEFMQKGSLEHHLFRRGSYHQPLSWAIRIKVALGAAKGLSFLHNLQRQVIYRDFKTSNILLDSQYNAKLSDFGLAKDGPTGSETHVSTRIMGTYGYAAPEYVATGHLTAKSDVYGFGVVLLEILSGLRAVDTNRPSGQHSLVEWVKPSLGDRRKIYQVMDHRLEGQFPPKGAHKAAMLALQCLSTEAKQRPPMKEVVERLEQLEAIKYESKIPSVANGNGNVSPRNMNYSSPGHARHASSPLYSYQRSPKQKSYE